MAGQPQVSPYLVFDVTGLEVTAEPGLAPVNIVKKGDDFEVTATFTGTGSIWTLLELISDLPSVEVVGMVTFSAEGYGADADEKDFGPGEVVLAAGGSPYPVPFTIPKDSLDPGVYGMACHVTFEIRAGGSSLIIPGVTGHYKGLGPSREDLSVYAV